MSDSEDDLFGGAASWMEEAEEEGTVDVDVARKETSDDVRRRTHQSSKGDRSFSDRLPVAAGRPLRARELGVQGAELLGGALQDRGEGAISLSFLSRFLSGFSSRFSHALRAQQYDWLTGFAGIEALLNKHMARTDKVLVVGCGNSTLSRDMYLLRSIYM
jgi:hypothetical protein